MTEMLPSRGPWKTIAPETSFEVLPVRPAGYELKMPRQEEATELVAVGLDVFGREQRLAPEVAMAWAAMREAAAREGVRLLLVSGFRSVARQREILERKLATGMPWMEILRVNAYPGHSEHHTGRVIDIGSPDCEHLSESLETTREFRWLTGHARRFGFTMSYPSSGDSGVVYEPWHWRWRSESPATTVLQPHPSV